MPSWDAILRRHLGFCSRPITSRNQISTDGLYYYALIPALVAASKAAALGAVGGAAGYGVKKGLEAATRKKKKKR